MALSLLPDFNKKPLIFFMCELVSLTFFLNFVHQMLGFINLFSEFLLNLLKFWPKSFKTLMLSQQLKKKKLRPLECPAVPGGMSGGRSGARSGPGVQRVSRGVSILLIECHEWKATFQIFFQYKTQKTELLELVFLAETTSFYFKDNFHVHFLTFHGHNFRFFSRALF